MITVYSSKIRLIKFDALLTEESCFREAHDYVLDKFDSLKPRKSTCVETWEDAKEFVYNLLQSKYPNHIIRTAFLKKIEDYSTFSLSPREKKVKDPVFNSRLSKDEKKNEILALGICVYIILISRFHIVGDDELNKCVNNLDDLFNESFNINLEYYITDLDIVHKVAFGQIVHDYDYSQIDGKNTSDCSVSNETINTVIANTELSNENNQNNMPNENGGDKSKHTKGIQLKSAIVMMEKLWPKIKKDVTRKTKAEFFSALMGYSYDYCYNNLTGDYDVSEEQHGEDIKRCNQILLELDVKRPIQFNDLPKKE